MNDTLFLVVILLILILGIVGTQLIFLEYTEGPLLNIIHISIFIVS